MTEPSDVVLEFLKKLVTEVRDVAIDQASISLDLKANGTRAKRWRSLGIQDGPAAREIIRSSVDGALFSFLTAVVEQRVRIVYHSESGQAVDVGEVGFDWIQGAYAAGEEGLEALSKHEWEP